MADRSGDKRAYDGMSTLDGRVGQQGDKIVSLLHAEHYENCIRQKIFFSTNLAKATTVAGVNMVGNIIWNPPASGVNLEFILWKSVIAVTSATTTGVGLAFGYQTTPPTTVTPADAFGNTATGIVPGALLQTTTPPTAFFKAGKALCYSVATLLFAPVLVNQLYHNTAAISGVGAEYIGDDMDAIYILPPGGIACLVAVGATMAASAHSSTLIFKEIPVL